MSAPEHKPASTGGICLVVTVGITLVWAMVLGSTSALTLLSGVGLGFVISIIVIGERRGELLKPWGAAIRLAVTVFIDLITSSLQVAHDVLTPRHRSTPRIIKIPIDLKTTGARVSLANSVTLTPGTLTLDLDNERGVLYIHAMYAEDPDAIVESIQKQLVKPLSIIEGSAS